MSLQGLSGTERYPRPDGDFWLLIDKISTPQLQNPAYAPVIRDKQYTCLDVGYLVRIIVFNITLTILQLYRGGQFYWRRKLEDVEKTADLSQVVGHWRKPNCKRQMNKVYNTKIVRNGAGKI